MVWLVYTIVSLSSLIIGAIFCEVIEKTKESRLGATGKLFKYE